MSRRTHEAPPAEPQEKAGPCTCSTVKLKDRARVARHVSRPGFTKRRLYAFLLSARDGVQVALDATPSGNKLRICRLLGRREAFEDLLGVLDDEVIEKTVAQIADRNDMSAWGMARAIRALKEGR